LKNSARIYGLRCRRTVDPFLLRSMTGDTIDQFRHGLTAGFEHKRAAWLERATGLLYERLRHIVTVAGARLPEFEGEQAGFF
jgi:hypothetical protein